MSELNRLSAQDFKASKKFPYQVVLEEVRSVLNVGSVFRSADAFRCESLALIGLTPTPGKEMRKTALGATEAVHWQHYNDIEALLLERKKEGYKVWAVEQTTAAVPLQKWQPSLEQKQLFIFGNEVTGVSDRALALCNGAIEIPQFGTKHSLNISVSAGIVMWDYVRRLL